MDNLEKEKLFLDIDGPTLKAYRNIYAPQVMENGVKFGAARNQYGANIVQIVKSNETFSIIFIKIRKPNFKKGTPYSKKVMFEYTGELEEIKEILHDSFR